jgi:cellulose synthase operon protein C
MRKIAFFLSILVYIALCGCQQQQSSLVQAKRYAALAEKNFAASAALYEKILAAEPGAQAVQFAAGMLYYSHGEFDRAIEHLRRSSDPGSLKYLAMALYRSGDYTAAHEVCSLPGVKDDEFRYYQGLVSEKLNLFDQALASYRQIKSASYAVRARSRMEIIEKAVNPLRIENLDPATAAIVAQSPSQQAYPQAGALILLSDEKVEITPDNKAVYRLHYIVRILNERGKESFSEAPIEYDSTDEKVQLEYARTIRPDGTVVDVGSRHIRDVSKYLNFPLYSNARVFIISFPEIAEGATVEYNVTVYRSQLINKKDFVIPLPVQAQEPVIDSRFSLTMPADRPLNLRTINEKYNVFGADLKPVVSRTSAATTYKWQSKNIPQIIPEPAMPPLEEITPSIVLSSFRSWQEIYDWWWQLAKDKIKANAAIKQKVAELIKGLASEEARLKAIHNFCAQKIRYVAVEYGQAGYEPHQAGDIYQNKYGDCKDQAILLVTMLKEAGFQAWPVLIPTRDSFDMDPGFPSMLFNHCIAVLSWKGQLIFMDPTAETCSFGDLPAGDQDRNVLVIKEDGFMPARTPLYPAGHNTVNQRLSLAVVSDGSVSGTRTISSSGVYDQSQRYWLLYTVPDVVKDTISAKIQEFSIGASLDDGYKVENLNDLNRPIALRYAFHGPEFLTSAGPLRILPALSNLDMTAVTKASRLYPIVYPMLDLKDIETVIALPPGYEVRYMPEPIAQENQWMKFSSGYSMQANTLVFRQKMELRQRLIAQESYQEYKDFIEQLGKRLKQRVVLERKK